MMLAVMYGMIPRAKMARCSSAPPENRLIREYSPAWSPLSAAVAQMSIWLTLTLGTGTIDPNRKTARIPSVKRIFLRRSGVRNALAKAESTRPSLPSSVILRARPTSHAGPVETSKI